ncbi:MAG: hypothetical protein V1664_03910 [Candidatus Uhrbacteria bacterium]
MENPTTCCSSNRHQKTGVISGLLAGLIPHSFCLLFITLSVIGATGATALTKKVLLVPFIFPLLIGLSLLFATLSAVVYLKKTNQLCLAGIKNKWRYLSILFTVTIATNALLIFFIFPATINGLFKTTTVSASEQSTNLSIAISIPCSGHAALIIDELKKDPGIETVNFQLPNIFNISYEPTKTSPEQIQNLEIFQTFKIIN